VLRANKIWLSLLFVLSSVLAFSQLQLDDDEWQNKRDDYEYGTETRENESSGNNIPHANYSDTAEIVKMVFFVIILAVLIFLIYKLIISNIENKKTDEGLVFIDDLSKVEDNLMRADLEKLLQQMIDRGDYRSAIRVQYLQIIQRLSKKKHIKWAKQKTNFDYLKELKEPTLSNDFSKTTLIYESAWFGHQQITAQRFKEMSEYHNHLKNLIQ